VARRLFASRDDDLVGGLVLRRFEPLTGAEVRTWWIDGECRLVGAHPDTPDELPADAGIPVRCLPAGLAEAVRGLRLPFVTVDLARRADGAWRVVELGDGQVRDRPAPLMPEHLIAAL
jgi:hypothetical protein